jgi:hypothetical protein
LSQAAGSLLVGVPAAASNEPNPSLNKLALNAYCAEARSKSSLLSNGSISYKKVVELASERAFVEYPYVDRSAWKAKISVLLDQYGDDPTTQLCSDSPDPGRDLDLLDRY